MKTRAEGDDEIPLYRAVDWEPIEISFVAIPADNKSQVRSEESTYECEIIQNNGEEEMKTKGKAAGNKPVACSAKPEIETEMVRTEGDNKPTKVEEDDSDDEDESNEPGSDSSNGSEGGPVPSNNEPPKKDKSDEEVRALEMKRGKDIRTSVRLAGLDENFADMLIEKSMSVDKARAEIFKALEKNQPETRNNNIEVRDMDNKTLRREAMTRALLHRFDSQKFPLKEGDNTFMHGSLLMSARNYISAEGERNAFAMSDSEVAKRALHHTPDFPILLGNVANASFSGNF